MIKLSEVLNVSTPAHLPKLADKDIEANCPNCGWVRADKSVIRDDAETHYDCAVCEAPLVILTTAQPIAKPWPGRGYRLGPYVLRNAVDLRLYDGRAMMPASPHALDKLRPGS